MKVLLTADAEKQFLKLPKPERNKIEKKLKLLSQDPHAGKKISRGVRGSTVASCLAV
jgi:mRNA-degrading endonuclease RelE of RelBE toxin-antitoxin system